MLRPLTTSEAAGMPAAAVVDQLRTDPARGLSNTEATRRASVHGANEMASAEEESLAMKFLEQFKDPMIGLLGVSAIVSVAMGQYDDAVSITLAVIIVTIVAFVQEYRSDQSLAALGELAPPMCAVLRGGEWVTKPAVELVIGDVVKLSTGDRVPADIRLLSTAQLSVDEATLTGESDHASKTATVVPGPTVEVPDRTNIAFMGTMVTRGKGKGVVVCVGDKTEFGVVFSLMRDTEEARTPLQQRMDALGKKLSIVSLGIIGVIALIGWLGGKPLMEMFTIGVSLAVAAIPEGLPIVVTVTLALGVIRMAKKNAIVKKLPAVEALGCASVVCVDKTGTLTLNQMTAVQLYSPAEPEMITFTGTGYGSEGQVLIDGSPITPMSHPHVALALEAASVCNDASLSTTRGQPTELALQTAAAKFGVHVRTDDFNRSFELPFSSETKWMAVRGHAVSQLLRTPAATTTSAAGAGAGAAAHLAGADDVEHEAFFLKGTTEAVLTMCTTYVAGSDLTTRPLDDAAKARILAAAHQMGTRGLRVLSMASGPSLHSGLTFSGTIAMRDPLRASAKPSVDYLRQSGVTVCMITGDSRDTACSIAASAGILASVSANDPEVSMSGREIEQMTVDELVPRIARVRVFYRAAPIHKMSIVQALRQRGAVVAMTGDGVNDAPALKAADIGVALGRAGTDVCKEAADMIIMDDDVSAILAAIEEGKSLFHNIRNFVRFQISTSVAALWLVAYSTVTGRPNPLNAMQILWINILMDGPPAQSLGVEPVDLDVMKLPPRPAKQPIITRRLLALVSLSAFFIVAGTEFVFVQEMSDGVVTRRDTTMTFTTFVLFDMFAALSCRSATKSVLEIGLFSNRFFLLAVGCCLLGQVAVVYLPPLQGIFQTEALSLGDWLFVICLSSTVLIADEIRKLYERNRPVRSGARPTGDLTPLFGSRASPPRRVLTNV